MTTPLTPQARLRAAKIIHGSLMAGVIVFVLVTAWVHRVAPPLVQGDFVRVLRYVGLALFVGAAGLLRVFPRPDSSPTSGQSPDQWWAASLARLIMRWALMEGAALFNAVVWFIGRERIVLVPVGLALLVLFVLRPSRSLE
jgi:hypothetical protein